MEDKLHRRGFLERLTLGFTSLLTLPVQSMANKLEKEKNMQVIKSIKPLGFQWETEDPFLFCVHHEDDFPQGNDAMGPSVSLAGRHMGDDFIIKDGFRMYHGKVVPGFPGHPHRGFETITVVRKGLVDHADSLGAAGRYGFGDVQWMTAGKGVQHSEMFPLINKDKGNPLELFQIWLNLPAKDKMVEPHFKMLWSDQIPNMVIKDSNGRSTTVEVIAGSIGEYKAASPPPNSWAANPANEVAVWNIKMEANAEFQLPPASSGINRNVYFYKGKSLKMDDTSIPFYHAVSLFGDAKVTIKNGEEECGILVLQGKPIGEHVIQYGPFVMNTKEEINQAFSDYHATKFGGWPWPRYDQVHDRNRGRFARHADGSEEIKG